MRQQTQKRLISVSAYNPNPQRPEGYFDVLHEAGVHRDFFQLYANWVRSFFAKNPGRARRSLGAKEIAAFLNELGPEKSDSATQRLQAREALILYCEKFRGIPLVKRKRAQAHGHPASRPTKGKVADAIHRQIHSSSSSTGRLDWSALQTAYLTAIRVENYARSTEKTYWHWIREFLQYHQGRRPSKMGASEIEAYLGFLAMKKQVAASTQNQALNSIVFLYRNVIKKMWGISVRLPGPGKGNIFPWYAVVMRWEIF